MSPVKSNKSPDAVGALVLLLISALVFGGNPYAEGKLHSSVVQQKLQTSSNANGIPLIITSFLHSFQHGVSLVAQESEHPAVKPMGFSRGSTINWHCIPMEQFTGLVM